MHLAEIEDWASSEIRIIELTQGNSSIRWNFRVRRFIPQDGDSLERTWLSKRTGTRQYHPVTPYALVSMKETGEYLSRSLEKDIDIIIGEFVGKEST
jgi:hypothetical protein